MTDNKKYTQAEVDLMKTEAELKLCQKKLSEKTAELNKIRQVIRENSGGSEYIFIGIAIIFIGLMMSR